MKKVFKIAGYLVAGLLGVIAAGIIYMQYAFPKVDAAPVITIDKTPELIKRGEYLANHVSLCIDCHSERDWSLMTGPITDDAHGKGGEVFDQSMGLPGTFYSKNITSDKETGIGTWTDGEIYRAITSGVSRNGEPIFPIMPYKSYAQLSTKDAYAIVAYIRTLPAVKHKVPESDPDFPMNIIMRTIPSKTTPAPEPVLDTPMAKGKYLVTVGACAECHTPQDKGEPVTGKLLAGGMEFGFPNGAVVRSANITPDKETGIGNWTEDAFVKRFKDYATPEAKQVKAEPNGYNTIMPWTMYAGMTEEDLRAIYQYLMTLEPNKNKVVKFTPAKS